jgi:hypothetical protein
MCCSPSFSFLCPNSPWKMVGGIAITRVQSQASFDLYSSPLHLCKKQILDITYWIGNMHVDLWVVSAAGQWIT